MSQFTRGPWYLMDEHLQQAATGDEFPTICGWDGEQSVTVAIASPDADEMYDNAKLLARAWILRETLEQLLAAFDATCAAGRGGVSPAQGIVQRDAARKLLAELGGVHVTTQ